MINKNSLLQKKKKEKKSVRILMFPLDGGVLIVLIKRFNRTCVLVQNIAVQQS